MGVEMTLAATLLLAAGVAHAANAPRLLSATSNMIC
jgi:hypothetical protein